MSMGTAEGGRLCGSTLPGEAMSMASDGDAGDMGGLKAMLSADCFWLGKGGAGGGDVICAGTGDSAEEGSLLADGATGQVVTRSVSPPRCGFSLSISTGLGPDTVRFRFFSSAFKSATFSSSSLTILKPAGMAAVMWVVGGCFFWAVMVAVATTGDLAELGTGDAVELTTTQMFSMLGVDTDTTGAAAAATALLCIRLAGMTLAGKALGCEATTVTAVGWLTAGIGLHGVMVPTGCSALAGTCARVRVGG